MSIYHTADEIATALREIGTTYEQSPGHEPDDSASCHVVRAGRQLYLRVADGCGSEWFGRPRTARKALAALRRSRLGWQHGWDALGLGDTAPDQWEPC